MNNDQAISTSNQELKVQNEYLRKQFGDFVKQKQMMYAEPTRSEHGKENS